MWTDAPVPPGPARYPGMTGEPGCARRPGRAPPTTAPVPAAPASVCCGLPAEFLAICAKNSAGKHRHPGRATSGVTGARAAQPALAQPDAKPEH